MSAPGTIKITTDVSVTTRDEPHEMIPHAEMLDWCKHIEMLADPVTGASAWATTFLGMAISGALTLAATYAADTNDSAANPVNVPGWLYVIYVATIIGGLAMMAFCLWVNHRIKKQRVDRVVYLSERIHDRMGKRRVTKVEPG